MRTSARSLALLTLLAALIACGDPEPTPPVIQNNGNNTPTPDMADLPGSGDMGDLGLDPDQPGGDMGEDMMMVPEGAYCREVSDDLGVIDVTAGVKTIMGDTTGGMSVVGSACGFNSAPERVFKFTLSGPARLDLALTPSSALNWAMDVRAGDCDATTSLFCSRNPNTTITANDDKTYFLLVEPLDSAAEGRFQINITPTPLVCLPVGDRKCDGPNLTQCIQGGLEEEELTCAAPCAMNACGGDVCDNAIVVNTFPFDLEGPAEPYTSSFNFSGPNTCINPDTAIIPPDPNDPDATTEPGTPGMPTGSIATPGEDVVFRLPGLMAGQKLTVDASTALGDESDNAIFVLNTCDPMSCLTAIDLGDVLSGWNVPANGDYTVVVDRRSGSSKPIKVRINVE